MSYYNNNNNNNNNNNGSSNELRRSVGNWRTIQDHHFETGQRPPPRSSWNTQLWGPIGYSLSRFPTQSVHSPMRLIVLNSSIPREIMIPGQRPTIRVAPPAYFGQHSFSIPTYQEQTESRPSPDRQSNAMKMLKKEIYNSPPKSITRRLSSFYRERDQGKPLTERTIEQNDDEHGKRCAVCLEDFEPKQEVMVTPCRHMFHEDCIVPWMKNNDQCPVCRFVMGENERPRQRTMRPVNNGSVVEDMAANNLFADELISVIRAMEEAFQWGSVVP